LLRTLEAEGLVAQENGFVLLTPHGAEMAQSLAEGYGLERPHLASGVA
jgi:Mn-dependent DtxR family transcriptional regulator